MSITVNSYSVTGGLLIIDSTVTSPADYKIHTFYVLCNGHYADEVVPFWDRISPAYQQVMTTANRRSYIDLSIFPNGSLTFSVRCKHAKTIAPIGSILEDTAVDVTVENSSFVTLLTPLATTYPLGTATEVSAAATGSEYTAQTDIAAASGSGAVATTGTEQAATAGTATSTGSSNVAALGIDTSLEIGQATATGGDLAPGFYLRSAAGIYYALADSQGRQYALSN